VREEQFRTIYREYGRKLYNFILWTVRCRAASDDILQNVFIKLLKIDNYPTVPEELQRWLFAVTRNACLDHLRSATRFSRFRVRYGQEYMPPEPDPDTKDIWDKIAELAETDRMILFLHLKIGYTYKEIAEMNHMNEGQVRVKAFRALERLRSRLQKPGGRGE
jgi:RNA polymerase sigma-70 factor, ECF subfamily